MFRSFNPGELTNAYNGFGEITSSSLAMGTFSKTLTAIYDAGGRRTRLTHPDAQAFTYAYDALDRLTNVYEGTTTATPLDGFAYNDDGTLASRSEGTGISSAAYSWDGIGRLTAQSDTIAGTNGNVGWTFTLNPASQIAAETRDNDSYAFSPVSNVNRNYSVNGLNQYTTVAGTAQTYDANGNLTSDGSAAYVYDIENRLVKATIDNEVTNLVYDPLGRLFQTDQGSSGSTTKFLYDGDALISEHNSSNALTARYVHGSNAAADDPLVWYTGTGSSSKRYLHADHLGSIIGVTNASGSSVTKNAYDEYGQPDSSNSGRFQYTGQTWVPEVGLYYYKARFYSPVHGRFMQVDPIGYDDQINLYAYVGSDPLNSSDPTGEYVYYSRSGNVITLHWNIAYYGASNTASQRQKFSSGIARGWSGRFGQFTVKASVTTWTYKPGTRPSNETIRGNPRMNFVDIPHFTYRARTIGDQRGVWGANRPASSAAHEAGHMANLEDQYDRSGPFAGHENEIMGASGMPVTEQTIRDLIEAQEGRPLRNNTRSEPSQGNEGSTVNGCPYVSAQPTQCGGGFDIWQ